MGEDENSYQRVYVVLESTLKFFVDAIPYCSPENVRLFEQRGLLPHNLTRKNTITGEDESLEQLLFHSLQEQHGVSPEWGRRFFGSVYPYLLDNGILRANAYLGCLPPYGLQNGVYYSLTTPLSAKERGRMISEIMRRSMMHLGLLPGEEYDCMLKGTSELCRPRGTPLSPKTIFEKVFPRLLRQHGIPYRSNHYHNGHNQTNSHGIKRLKRISSESEAEKT